jgi:hypothetical protein
MSLQNAAIERLPYVEGVLNYLKPTTDKPRTYAFELPPGAPRVDPVHEPHMVPIRDVRPVAELMSLDREGFALVAHRSAVTDFADEDQLRRIYYPEAERLVAAATGGARVVIFDHTVRRRIPGKEDRQPGVPRQPSTRIHGDYSIKSGPQRVRDVMGEEAEALLQRRFAIVNVWRPIRGPLRDAPLALCDARSVGPGDLVAADLVYRDRTGENYLMTYRPGHRWFYAPDMRVDEALLLKCYDSAEDGRTRFVPHTAFLDPTAPADALPRESIELRTLVFYSA